MLRGIKPLVINFVKYHQIPPNIKYLTVFIYCRGHKHLTQNKTKTGIRSINVPTYISVVNCVTDIVFKQDGIHQNPTYI